MAETPRWLAALLYSLVHVRSPRRRGRGGKIVGGRKQARNTPCRCGSGHKYKRCCGATAQQRKHWARMQKRRIQRTYTYE